MGKIAEQMSHSLTERGEVEEVVALVNYVPTILEMYFSPP